MVIQNANLEEEIKEPHYFFEPADFCLSGLEKEFVQAAVAEKVKLALLRGDEGGLADELKNLQKLKDQITEQTKKISQLKKG